MGKNKETLYRKADLTEQSGRTMLEMLGVIAIMGLITYGAISGINYGMSSYRVNQTFNEVQDLISGIEDLYSWSRGTYDPDKIVDAVCNNDVISCTVENGKESPSGVFGPIVIGKGNVIENGNWTNKTDDYNFQIVITGFDETECVRIDDMAWAAMNINHDCTCEGSLQCKFQPM